MMPKHKNKYPDTSEGAIQAFKDMSMKGLVSTKLKATIYPHVKNVWKIEDELTGRVFIVYLDDQDGFGPDFEEA